LYLVRIAVSNTENWAPKIHVVL